MSLSEVERIYNIYKKSHCHDLTASWGPRRESLVGMLLLNSVNKRKAFSSSFSVCFSLSICTHTCVFKHIDAHTHTNTFIHYVQNMHYTLTSEYKGQEA